MDTWDATDAELGCPPLKGLQQAEHYAELLGRINLKMAVLSLAAYLGQRHNRSRQSG